jgi:hypothetical protein
MIAPHERRGDMGPPLPESPHSEVMSPRLQRTALRAAAEPSGRQPAEENDGNE